MYTVKFASIDTDNLLLGVSAPNNKSKNVTCEVRFVDQDRFLVRGYLDMSSFDSTIISDNLFIFNINLNELLKNNEFDSSNQRLEFIIKTNDSYYPLKTTKEVSNMLSEVINLNDEVSIKYIKKEKGIFDLRIITKPLDVEIIDVKINDSTLYLSTNNTKDFDIFVKRRTFKSITKYSSEQKLEYQDGKFSINLSDLFELTYDYQTNFDFAVRKKSGKSKIDNLIKINFELNKQKIVVDNYNIELYATTTKSLALIMKKVHKNVDASFEVNKDILTVTLSDDKINKLAILRKLKLSENIIDTNEYYIVSNDVGNGKYAINISEVFSKNNSNINQEYILMGIKDKEYYHLISPDSKTIFGNFIKIHTNSQDTTIVNPIIEDKAIKLAILGSCYSRAAFNSKEDFFNKDYKAYYSVTYSSFWFSALSSMSKPIPYDQEFLKNESDKIKNNDTNIRREFEKTLFKELEKADFEYLILDFFVDAVHGVRDFGENVYLSRNVDLNSTSFFKNHILLETKHFSYRNEDYFDKWCESVDRFIKELKNRIPLNNIILNLGGLTHNFLNENNEIRSFSKERNFEEKMIKNHNIMWQRMNNYFITKVPEAKVVDLSRYNFYGLENYPNAASGPHHFEPNYYKAYVGELSKAIVRNSNL